MTNSAVQNHQGVAHPFLPRRLPPELEALADLALDLRWTWSHGTDHLWQALEPAAWEITANPWAMLQTISQDRLEELAHDKNFVEQLNRAQRDRVEHLDDPGWYGRVHTGSALTIAYFSMEFGLGKALRLYAGGLGILAGDFLKAASDLAVPVVGVGLLFQEGYFRQVLDENGAQLEAYPYNDPAMMPIFPVRERSGGWLSVPIELPGRSVLLRVWHAHVGRVDFFLLDSNHPLNSPSDRGIASKLYDAEPERRMLQEIVLGVGGWRALESMGINVEVLHLNEGHVAFASLEPHGALRRRWDSRSKRHAGRPGPAMCSRLIHRWHRPSTLLSLRWWSNTSANTSMTLERQYMTCSGSGTLKTLQRDSLWRFWRAVFVAQSTLSAQFTNWLANGLLGRCSRDGRRAKFRSVTLPMASIHHHGIQKIRTNCGRVSVERTGGVANSMV